MTRLSVRQTALYAPQQDSRHSITLAVTVFLCRPRTGSHSTGMCARAFLQQWGWLRIYQQQPVAFRDSCIFLHPLTEKGESHMQGDKATEGERGGAR